MEAASFLKSRNPHSVVEVRDLKSGEVNGAMCGMPERCSESRNSIHSCSVPKGPGGSMNAGGALSIVAAFLVLAFLAMIAAAFPAR
jgi:hypothetical protein